MDQLEREIDRLELLLGDCHSAAERREIEQEIRDIQREHADWRDEGYDRGWW